MCSVSVSDVALLCFLLKGILDDAAQPEEVNLVQVSTSDPGGKPIIAPLVYLTSGTHYQRRLSAQLPDSLVVFNLSKGSGPIYLLGLHTVAAPMEDSVPSEALEVGNKNNATSGKPGTNGNGTDTDVDAAAGGMKKQKPVSNAFVKKFVHAVTSPVVMSLECLEIYVGNNPLHFPSVS